MKHIVSLIFILYLILCKQYFENKLVCFFPNLFVLNMVHEISINIRKCLSIFRILEKQNICIFSNQSKSKILDICKMRIKSQILKLW